MPPHPTRSSWSDSSSATCFTRACRFARHFARRVLDADSDGAIDAAALGLDGFRPVQRPQHYVRPIEDVTAVALLALCVLPFV
jgi:hypothetical protein